MVGIVLAAAIAAGSWQVMLNEDTQELVLSQPEAKVEVRGKIEFRSEDKSWKVVQPRDAVKTRLGLVAPDGNVQGYLTFPSEGGLLRMMAYHRTAQAYLGELTYSGEIRFRPESFACRTRPANGERVLALASGAADSLLNDSLFARDEDLALRMNAAHKAITDKGDGVYAFWMRGYIQLAAECMFSFHLERDYFKSRWVPCYAPIDRKRCPKPPTGWMSWNTYFDQAGAEENLAEARIGKKYLQPFGMEFWSIESWQGNSPKLPVSNFYNMNLETYEKQFPLGMKKLAEDIRALGFRPGIWMAPFGTGNEAFYNAHKDWFLHDKDGKPISCWNGRYTLDPSVPKALEHLRKIFDTASHDWGYEFFKIDGMSGRNHGYCAHLYERPEIKACFHNPCDNPFERCVKTFREGIGPDRVFLACQGHFTGAEAAYADSSRTGADIVAPNNPVRWENILSQARCTENQYFVHNIVFYSDPDTILVGDEPDIEQARVTTTVVALPGQQTFAGDKLAKLPTERMKLLQQALPVADVHPVNLYPYFQRMPVWSLAVARPFIRYHVVALFNWDDAPKTVGADIAELGLDAGLDYAAYEFWTRKNLGVLRGRLEMPVPGRGVRLVALHKAEGRPQFMSSDRHVTQGAVELKALEWKAAADELDATLQVIGGFPMTARFRIPKGFSFADCATPEGVTAEARMEEPEMLAVTLSSPVTRDVPLALHFKKQ